MTIISGIFQGSFCLACCYEINHWGALKIHIFLQFLANFSLRGLALSCLSSCSISFNVSFIDYCTQKHRLKNKMKKKRLSQF